MSDSHLKIDLSKLPNNAKALIDTVASIAGLKVDQTPSMDGVKPIANTTNTLKDAFLKKVAPSAKMAMETIFELGYKKGFEAGKKSKSE